MKVYCIIVTYNAMKWVDKCLGSLRHSVVPINTIIVDNGSKDNTVPYITQNYPEVYIVPNDKNLGFGKANNIGIEYAYKNGATHFFLLNQDAWVYSDTIEKLINVQDKYNVGIVSPIHLNGKGDDIDHNFKLYITSDKPTNSILFRDFVLGDVKDHYDVPRINAAAWLLSVNTINIIGGFDPVFFLYGEDDNYLQRLYHHGLKLAFVPGSFIHHDRNIHGDTKAFNKLELRNWLVGSFTNINIPLHCITKRRIYWHIESMILFFKYLFTFRFKSAFEVCDSFISYLCSWPQILRSRKTNKQKGLSWLNI